MLPVMNWKKMRIGHSSTDIVFKSFKIINLIICK